MKKMSKTIVFFGSGPVAAESLRLLVKDFEIEAVITRPRPPHHRGEYPVGEVAEELDLKILTPADATELNALFETKPVTSQVGLVIDYGILISKSVIDYFPLGIINSHFSILPEWRGADPISFAILSGQPVTGVSLMLVDEGLDEGPILAQKEFRLAPTITTPELTTALIELSHKLLVETLPKYCEGQVKPISQASTGRPVSHSRKLTKEDGIIDWSKPAVEIEREVRAYAGWPRSRTKLGSTDVVITQAHVADGAGQPGQVVVQNKQLGVYTSDGLLMIDSLIPAGRKEMSAEAFLAGYKTS